MDARFAMGGAADAALGPSQKIKNYWCLWGTLLIKSNFAHNGF